MGKATSAARFFAIFLIYHNKHQLEQAEPSYLSVAVSLGKKQQEVYDIFKKYSIFTSCNFCFVIMWMWWILWNLRIHKSKNSRSYEHTLCKRLLRGVGLEFNETWLNKNTLSSGQECAGLITLSSSERM